MLTGGFLSEASAISAPDWADRQAYALELLDKLQQAAEVEKRHRFVDVQGRRKTFSRFVQQTLAELSRLQVLDKTTQKHIDALTQAFQGYVTLNLPQRMPLVDRLTEVIQTIQHASQNALQKSSGVETKSVLKQSVQYLKGVGPRFAAQLAEVGVQTVDELLYYFPRRYVDYQTRAKIATLEAGQDVTVLAMVRSTGLYQTKRNDMWIFNLTLADETGRMTAQWFASGAKKGLLESYKTRYAKGTQVMLSGKVKWDRFKNCPAMDRPQIDVLSFADTPLQAEQSQKQRLHMDRIVPIYPLTQGLNLRTLQHAMRQALDLALPNLHDPIQEVLLSSLKNHTAALKPLKALAPLAWALEQIHFPASLTEAETARKRLVFDELFAVQMRLAMARQAYKNADSGMAMPQHPQGLCQQFIRQLPFALTGAQQRVFDEIRQDMLLSEPMYRLLQGDVGSGKTVLAVLTLLLAIENAYQGALMAPTEILAEQHARRLQAWLTPLGLQVGLLTGSLNARARKVVLQGLENGQVHLVVGTHALIQQSVVFNNLGVIVVDEQHRFGVRQRTLLKAKGQQPHMLTMTATPIPRTLAMTLHGDLDVSVLNELPPGRTPIQTLFLPNRKENQVIQLLRHEVSKGRQAYVVFPLIEESETLSARAATTEAQRLKQIFSDCRVGLLHGKLLPEEKDTVMQGFVAHNIDILVSTTVIEVGVDVSNATVMIIQSADRFGLAQLHQLRGRVGRGIHQSYCVLMADNPSPETMERLNILVESDDGFVIAEKDLALRGPGEFLGVKQSGLPDFLLADLIHDQAILEQARQVAFDVVNTPEYGQKYPALLERLQTQLAQHSAMLGAG